MVSNLHVQESRAHERWECVVCVEVLLEGAQHLAERVRRGRHVRGVAGTTSADPVLAAAYFAAGSFSAPRTPRMSRR